MLPLKRVLEQGGKFIQTIKHGVTMSGTVTVNCFGKGDISTPFGGYKQSGYGGRDNSVHAHDQYIQLKTIWIDLADDADEAVE